MAHLPKTVKGKKIKGLDLMSRGKVRGKYTLPGYENLLFMLTSKRVSIFDFVLPFLIPLKDEVLNAINIFIAEKIYKTLCPQDIVAYGAGIDQYLPDSLKGNVELQKTATIVENLPPSDFEAIVRNFLLGSSVKPYIENGIVSGHRLPAGLKEGDALPFPIFTPSTKAEKGHDEHITFESVEKKHGGQPERLALQAMALGRNFLNSRGLEVLDTKFEMAFKNGLWHLVDERITPDSSRFCDLVALKKAKAKGKLPPSLDKQFVREWGKEMGLNRKSMDPENSQSLAYVEGLVTPYDVIAMTTKIYRYIAWRMFGEKLENFQNKFMGIDTKPKPVNIDVILGFRSDLEQAKFGLENLKNNPAVGKWNVHIISCHMNPVELMNYASSEDVKNTDVIVAGAGLAAALPGMIKAFLKAKNVGHIPVIGVGFEGKTHDANNAARLSIEQLPSTPVEISTQGKAYFGQDGCIDAINAAIEHEFLPNIPGNEFAEFHINF